MDRKDATSVKTGRRVTRWEALKDGFDETVKSIPIGSKVQVYCVGGYGFWSSSDYAHRIYSDLKKISSDADRSRLVEDVFSWGRPTGGTPLYDALFYACEDVQNFVRAGGNACVVVLDAAKVTFGDNVFVGPGCGFYTAGHPLDAERRNVGLEYAKPITVGDNVWIGGNCTILPGVTIGEGSVVAAGAVVAKDVPPRTVVGGIPAKVIKKI